MPCGHTLNYWCVESWTSYNVLYVFVSGLNRVCMQALKPPQIQKTNPLVTMSQRFLAYGRGGRAIRTQLLL